MQYYFHSDLFAIAALWWTTHLCVEPFLAINLASYLRIAIEYVVLKKNNRNYSTDGVWQTQLNPTKVPAGSIPLSKFFDKSLESSVLPDCWKEALVTPAFKNRDCTKDNNYCLISLTSPTCKIMESTIKDNIQECLEVNHVIPSSAKAWIYSKKVLLNSTIVPGVHGV